MSPNRKGGADFGLHLRVMAPDVVRFAAVITVPIGTPRAFVRRWIFVEKPRREQPRAFL
jgi:hypothetical protein